LHKKFHSSIFRDKAWVVWVALRGFIPKNEHPSAALNLMRSGKLNRARKADENGCFGLFFKLWLVVGWVVAGGTQEKQP
jgi:hypothetical protein